MKKYIFMYNIDNDYISDEMIRKLGKANVDYSVEDYGLVENKEIDHWDSLWIEEKHYLIAWTLINYNDILGYHLWEDSIDHIAQDGLNWLEKHKENVLYSSN